MILRSVKSISDRLLARAKLIEQQTLIAARSGLSIGSVERIDTLTSIAGAGASADKIRALESALQSRSASNPLAVTSGMGMLGVSGSSTDPNILAKIAAGFAAIEDPAKRAEAAVRLFGADQAGDALQQLTGRFAAASDAATRFGLGLNATARTQIYQFRRDLLSMAEPFVFLKENIKAAGKSIEETLAQMVGAADDLAHRLNRALGTNGDSLLGNLIGRRPQGLSLTAQELAGAGQRLSPIGDVEQGQTADMLFAQAQLAAFRQSQTLEGRQAAQQAAQSRADTAYSSLSDDAAKRAVNPSDPSLLSGDQRMGLATEQQSAAAMAAAIGVKIAAMKALADAQKNAALAAREATETLRSSDEDQLASLRSMHALSVGEVIQYWQQRIAAESGNAARLHEIGITLGNLYQEQDSVIQRVAAHGAEIMSEQAKRAEEWKAKREAIVLELDELDKKVLTEPAEAHKESQAKVAEVTAKGAGAVDELQIEAQKLKIEQEYGLEARHTAAEQIAYLRQIAALEEKARQDKIAGVVADQAILIAERDQFLAVGETGKADDDRLKIAKLQVDIDEQRAKAANDLYISNTKILDVLRQQGMAGFFWKMNRDAKTPQQIAQDGITSAIDKFSDDLAKMMSDPKHAHPAKMFGDTLKSLGQEEMKESIKAGLQRSLGTLFGKTQGHWTPTFKQGDPGHVVVDNMPAGSGPAAVSPSGSGAGNTPLPGYGKVFGGASGVPGVFNLLGGGGSMPFGGALAGGGDVDPGTAYIVGDGGESEVFTPGVSGRVTPMSQLGSGGDIHYHVDARGSTDPTLTAVNVKRAILAAHADAVTTGVLLNQEQQKRSVQG